MDADVKTARLKERVINKNNSYYVPIKKGRACKPLFPFCIIDITSVL